MDEFTYYIKRIKETMRKITNIKFATFIEINFYESIYLRGNPEKNQYYILFYYNEVAFNSILSKFSINDGYSIHLESFTSPVYDDEFEISVSICGSLSNLLNLVDKILEDRFVSIVKTRKEIVEEIMLGKLKE